MALEDASVSTQNVLVHHIYWIRVRHDCKEIKREETLRIFLEIFLECSVNEGLAASFNLQVYLFQEKVHSIKFIRNHHSNIHSFENHLSPNK